MIREDILSVLPIKILELDHELRNRLLQFLYSSIELAKQFPLRYHAMKKFEELSANVLKCRKFPRTTAGIPPDNRSIEGQCEFCDFGCIDLRSGGMLH